MLFYPFIENARRSLKIEKSRAKLSFFACRMLYVASTGEPVVESIVIVEYNQFEKAKDFLFRSRNGS